VFAEVGPSNSASDPQYALERDFEAGSHLSDQTRSAAAPNLCHLHTSAEARQPPS
jgi:hypothetical protein